MMRLNRWLWIAAAIAALPLVGCDPPSGDGQTGAKTGVNQTGANQAGTTASIAELVTDPGRNAIHPIAERSAFPQPDETFAEPIGYNKLTERDPFVRDLEPEEIPDVVPWDQAKQYLGYTITVEGTIVSVGQSGDGRVNFLNFHKDWRDKFYMVVFDDLAKTLDQSVEDTFKGKRVRVRGEVEPHRGSPQIKIRSMKQVEFVDG